MIRNHGTRGMAHPVDAYDAQFRGEVAAHKDIRSTGQGQRRSRYGDVGPSHLNEEQ